MKNKEYVNAELVKRILTNTPQIILVAAVTLIVTGPLQQIMQSLIMIKAYRLCKKVAMNVIG